MCVSLQELLPEEILQAALVAGKEERRLTRRWGKRLGWAKREVLPSRLGALKDQ